MVWIGELTVGDALSVLIAAVGLGLIVWQIQRLQQQTSLQNFYEYTKRYQEIVQRFPESINDKPLDFFKIEEREKVLRAMRIYFDLCYEEWFLNKEKLIDKRYWNVWRGGIKTAMLRPAFQDSWKIVRDSSNFGNEFNSFLDKLLVAASNSPPTT